MAVGGVNAVLPELHRVVVENNHWITNQQFRRYVHAIANASPGTKHADYLPVSAGISAGSGARCCRPSRYAQPTCLLTYAVAHAWERFKDAPLRIAIQAGLVPVTVGLIAASARIYWRARADQSFIAYGITGVTAAICYFTRIHTVVDDGRGGGARRDGHGLKGAGLIGKL